jgi:hypothetical protein
MRITAYEDIKNACAEAIMSIQTRSKEVEINETSYTIHDSNSTADSSTTAAKNQKKEEEFENEAESTREKEVRLADMPQ